MSEQLLETNYISRYRKLYNSKIISELRQSLSLKNIMQVPSIQKIVLNSSYAPAVTDSKKLNKYTTNYNK